MIKKFFQRLQEEFSEISFAASSLAFSTLLSIIPFFIIVLAVFQSIGGLEQFYPQIENVLVSSLKEATGSTVSAYVRNSLSNVRPQTLGITGALLLIFASLGLIRSIDIAFHRIWKIKIRKPIYRRIWLYWLVLILVPFLLAVFTGLKSINFINNVSQSIESQFLFSTVTSLFLVMLYKVIPDTKVKIIPALISALLASSALTFVQNSFLWFSLKVFKQNKIYGSLASFPIFLVWLLVVWYVVLAGVALCAFLHPKKS